MPGDSLVALIEAAGPCAGRRQRHKLAGKNIRILPAHRANNNFHQLVFVLAYPLNARPPCQKILRLSDEKLPVRLLYLSEMVADYIASSADGIVPLDNAGSSVAVAAAYQELVAAGLAAGAANSDSDQFSAALDEVAKRSPDNAVPAELLEHYVAHNGVEALRRLVA